MGDDDNALYREICRCPEDDTLRLAYADWLDEQPAETVRCRKCGGSGVTYSGCGYESLDCPRCDGSGRAADAARAARAAMIRAQCGVGAGERTAPVGAEPAPGRLRCPDCRGDGGFDAISCPACSGCGDLLLTRGGHRRWTAFARGLVDAVRCEPREVFVPGGAGRPTAWARAVVLASPVTKFYLAGLEPAYQDLAGTVTFRGGPPGPVAWWYVVPGGELDVDWETASGHWLPHWLRPGGGDVDPAGLAGLDVAFYSTPQRAREALAAEVGRLVRAAVYGAVDTRLSSADRRS